ncbi:MAG: hypothetical protein ACTSXH_11580 [Promethearchaeota archaeon]
MRYGEIILEIKDFTGDTHITEDLALEFLDNYYEERGRDKKMDFISLSS